MVAGLQWSSWTFNRLVGKQRQNSRPNEQHQQHHKQNKQKQLIPCFLQDLTFSPTVLRNIALLTAGKIAVIRFEASVALAKLGGAVARSVWIVTALSRPTLSCHYTFECLCGQKNLSMSRQPHETTAKGILKSSKHNTERCVGGIFIKDLHLNTWKTIHQANTSQLS